MKKTALALGILAMFTTHAQSPATGNDAWKKEYRAFATKTNDLVHTKLDAKFDYSKSYLIGKVWITLKPHFYATDSLQLDAKGMNINKVEIVKAGKNVPLKYTYDSLFLNITLDKVYKANEKYTVYIDYVAKPNEYTEEGSGAITDARGLFFINPKGEEKDKPTQIWTQGETEHNSVWLPTIDKPNQKATDEIYMTVPSKYVTLSNGKLVSQTKNVDGTRTDYWKMDLPHSPYLIFMGVGEYSIIKDTYKGKEVNYYVEKEYEKVARQIFGLTPEMIKFYSEKVTGIDYPWVKYSQIVGRDYVSGAMENTTATLHQENAQQNARELTDGNNWESTIAHELFHQWFGDLVTCESWSNLTVNESFANYSETLWDEYKHGADAGAEQNYSDMLGYLNSNSASKDLVRFHYADKEDMFDAVSYNKGGRILHMLRHYVGDSAFFKSLNLYLNTYKFGNGSADKLRLAFEAVTGKDLNWYWNQWYFGNGHPRVEISYAYDAQKQLASVFIKQTQSGDKVFKLPLDIDIYHGFEKKRRTVWMDSKADTFTFSVSSKPDLINVDGDKIILWDKKDNKTTAEFIHQYKYAKNFVDRREAIDYASKHKTEPAVMAFLKDALNDPYYKLRNRVLLQFTDSTLDAATLSKIEKMATSDVNRTVRSYAIDALAKTHKQQYISLYVKSVKDSSYSVAGAALAALADLDEAQAIALVPELKKDARGRLKSELETLEVLTKGDADFDEMTKAFTGKTNLNDKFNAVPNYIQYLGKVNNTENFKKGIDIVVAFRDQVAGYGAGIKGYFNTALKEMGIKKAANKAKAPSASDIDAQLAYLESKTKD